MTNYLEQSGLKVSEDVLRDAFQSSLVRQGPLAGKEVLVASKTSESSTLVSAITAEHEVVSDEASKKPAAAIRKSTVAALLSSSLSAPPPTAAARPSSASSPPSKLDASSSQQKTPPPQQSQQSEEDALLASVERLLADSPDHASENEAALSSPTPSETLVAQARNNNVVFDPSDHQSPTTLAYEASFKVNETTEPQKQAADPVAEAAKKEAAAAEAAKKKAADAEAAKKKAADAEAAKKKQVADAEAARKKQVADAEAKRQADAAAALGKKRADALEKKKQLIAAKKKKADEAAVAKKKADEEAAVAKKKQEADEAAAKKKQEDDAKRKKQDDDNGTRKKAKTVRFLCHLCIARFVCILFFVFRSLLQASKKDEKVCLIHIGLKSCTHDLFPLTVSFLSSRSIRLTRVVPSITANHTTTRKSTTPRTLATITFQRESTIHASAADQAATSFLIEETTQSLEVLRFICVPTQPSKITNA